MIGHCSDNYSMNIKTEGGRTQTATGMSEVAITVMAMTMIMYFHINAGKQGFTEKINPTWIWLKNAADLLHHHLHHFRRCICFLRKNTHACTMAQTSAASQHSAHYFFLVHISHRYDCTSHGFRALANTSVRLSLANHKTLAVCWHMYQHHTSFFFVLGYKQVLSLHYSCQGNTFT